MGSVDINSSLFESVFNVQAKVPLCIRCVDFDALILHCTCSFAEIKQQIWFTLLGVTLLRVSLLISLLHLAVALLRVALLSVALLSIPLLSIPLLAISLLWSTTSG